MFGNIIIIPVRTLSDGDASKRPPAAPGWVNNDLFWLERMAERYAKDHQHVGPGTSYRLDQLPGGYSGWEKVREKDPKHTDRFIYGHPNGVFRSTNEFYPHLKCLMDNGGAMGCDCLLCSGRGKGAVQKASENSRSSSPAPRNVQPRQHPGPSFPMEVRKFPTMANVPKPKHDTARPVKSMRPSLAQQVAVNQISSAARAQQSSNERGSLPFLPQGRLPDPPWRPKHSQVDEEETPDIYRILIDELRDAGPDSIIDKPITQSSSPDWRAGNDSTISLIRAQQSQPQYLPRIGEVVLFSRCLGDGRLYWDSEPGIRTYRHIEIDGSGSQSDNRTIGWEAGVVTQVPVEQLNDEDLVYRATSPDQSVNHAGFRVEPLSKPCGQHKFHTKQHKYVPLHAIRPFSLRKECTSLVTEEELHPTIKHAMMVSCSFTVICPYRFRGKWPEATLFVRGAYIGHELIQVGDVVRLLPKARDPYKKTEVDVMRVTAMKLRLVNLHEATDDDQDDGEPYNTCLHVSGKAYTFDPQRGFKAPGGEPVRVDSGELPSVLDGYPAAWYHIHDPQRRNARLEVPFTRIVGRCSEVAAIKAWFKSPPAKRSADVKRPNLLRDFSGTWAAREYGTKHDPRILRDLGQTWYWADTRVDQLDLHEVNGRFVGVKDQTRGWKGVQRLRRALRAMEGRQDALEALQQERGEQLRREKESRGKSGLMAGTRVHSADEAVDDADGAQAESASSGSLESEAGDSGSEAEPEHDDGGHDGEGDVDGGAQAQQPVDRAMSPRDRRVVIELDADSDEADEDARVQLMGEFRRTVESAGPSAQQR